MQTHINTPQDQLNRIEDRLAQLEKMVSQLLEKVEKEDIFYELVNSKAFEEHKNATIALYKKDPSRFVDPFKTFQENA